MKDDLINDFTKETKNQAENFRSQSILMGRVQENIASEEEENYEDAQLLNSSDEHSEETETCASSATA